MIVVVSGGRKYQNRLYVDKSLDLIHRDDPITRLVHGAARGVDFYAQEWAKKNNIEHIPYLVSKEDWDHDPRRAGVMRNQEMLDNEHPDLVVLFPGERGTNDMRRRALAGGYPIKECDPLISETRRTLAHEPEERWNGIALIGDIVRAQDVEAGGPFAWNCKYLMEDAAFEAGFNLFDSLVTCVFMEPCANIEEDRFVRRARNTKLVKDVAIDPDRPPLVLHKTQNYYLQADWDFEISRLIAELIRWKPKVIITLGAVPLWAITGMSNIWNAHLEHFLPNELTGYGTVLPTYSPNRVAQMPKSAEMVRFRQTFAQAAIRAKFRYPDWVFSRSL